MRKLIFNDDDEFLHGETYVLHGEICDHLYGFSYLRAFSFAASLQLGKVNNLEVLF
jgi:hypothetical protein